MTSHGNVWSVLLSVMTAKAADDKSLKVNHSQNQTYQKSDCLMCYAASDVRTTETTHHAAMLAILSRVWHLRIVSSPIPPTRLGCDFAKVGCQRNAESCTKVRSRVGL